jgi:hypothetical protein
MTSTPADEGEPRTVTGGRPLAMRSQGDRGPAYAAAVERSEAAFAHVRRVLGDQGVVLVDDAAQLAAIAASLPPETPVHVDDVVKVAVPGQGHVSAVAVTMTTLAETPATPVRDSRGVEHDVLLPGVQLGTVLLPSADAAPGEPQHWKPWRAWDKMLDTLDYGEPAEALDAIAGILDKVRGKLTDPELSPSGFLPRDSLVPAGIAGADAKLAELAEGLRMLSLLAAEEARRIDEDDDGTDRIGIAFIARVTGRAPVTDPAIAYLLDQAGGGEALGDGEAWDYPAIRAAHDATLAPMLAIGGITWQPGDPIAVLSPGLTIGDITRTWSESCDRAAEIIAAIAGETAGGRPEGNDIRGDAAPGRRWVTAPRDWGDSEAWCPECGAGAVFDGMAGSIPRWLCAACGHQWVADVNAG